MASQGQADGRGDGTPGSGPAARPLMRPLSQEQQGLPLADTDIAIIPISALCVADSPRFGGLNMDHARALAESLDALPPIVVHRETLRVIDGAHRVQAAMLCGAATVRARLFDGDDDAAFVLAVQSNVAHGLPLSLAERTAAATRILRGYSYWSDRRIGAVAGLSPKTVAAIRQRSSAEISQSNIRVGRDGRVRAVRPRPETRTAGPTGPELADSGAPDSTRAAAPEADRVPSPRPPQSAGADREPERTRLSVPGELSQDPSLRFSDTGRMLLRMLNLHSIDEQMWDWLAANVPPHCVRQVAGLARECAEAWEAFATELGED